jgi:hypothetical protein
MQLTIINRLKELEKSFSVDDAKLKKFFRSLSKEDREKIIYSGSIIIFHGTAAEWVRIIKPYNNADTGKKIIIDNI